MSKQKLGKNELTKILKCELSEEERRQAALQLTVHLDELSSLEKEKKSVTDSYKAKITECESKIILHKCRVRDGYEHRQVNCIKTLDYKINKVTVTRLDTGVIIEDRDMFVDEKQTRMEFDDDEKSG